MHACHALTRHAPACKSGGYRNHQAGEHDACRTNVPSADKLHHEDLEVGKPYDIRAPRP